MDKSNSETDQQASDDESETQRDEQPTTSRAENDSPVRNSHNMNDLKSLDFNSADEVRQAMKAVLAGQIPPQPFSEEAVQNEAEPADVTERSNKTHVHDLRKTVQRQVQQNLYLKMKASAQTYTGNGFRSLGLKRSGTPMIAGPSKSIKRPRKSLFYIGKLSNVVQFKSTWASDSESDVDSEVF